jgi:uroporphyrinogen decarboxylase
MMRQAGRVLPEYRALREKHSFTEVAHTPELCAEVTVQPVDRLGVDAAILFSDILTPLPAMGVGVDFRPGPVLERTLSAEDGLASLKRPDPEHDWAFLAGNVKATLERLGGRVPLIGFAGAPFTVACYAIDGGGSKSFSRTRAWMHGNPEGFEELLGFLADRLGEWLRVQVDAGVHAFQLFDSWAGLLAPADLERFALPAARRVLDKVAVPADFPTIYFAPQAGTTLELQAELPVRVLGVDWRTDLAAVRRRFPDRPLQGNLDPGILLGAPDVIERRAHDVLRAAAGGGHIFNLGHGILPDTPVENAEHLVRAVHAFQEEAA